MCEACQRIGASGSWHTNVRVHQSRAVSGGDTQATERLAGDLALIFDEAFELLLLKHENYGPKNISDSPGHKDPKPINGLLVRMHDKQARMRHMYYNDIDDVVGEDLRETAMDLLNYCAILIAVLDGDWPNE